MASETILIIEDDPALLRGLRDNFEFEGYGVATADDGEKGLEAAVNDRADLIVLDIMLPKKSGYDVCKELRGGKVMTPIIMLTSRGQEIDKVLGLELGADDYITKPFSVRELLARVHAVLRRTVSDTSEEKIRRIGSLFIDFVHYTAKNEKGEVKLTHKEFALLKYFWQHKGHSISRDELIENVWGYDAYPTSRTVDNHIVKIRKIIETDPSNPRHILTVHGIGYKYVG